jgi:predicted HAD superfamily Cof-like phosphohydrolase
MSTYFQQVGEFRKAMGKPLRERPFEKIPANEFDQQVDLIREEAQREFEEALVAFRVFPEVYTAADLLDACVDSIYVFLDFCHAMGFPFEEAWNEVHAANMRKRGADGKVHFRSDGKVLKPEGWKPPDIGRVIIDRMMKVDKQEKEQ